MDPYFSAKSLCSEYTYLCHPQENAGLHSLKNRLERLERLELPCLDYDVTARGAKGPIPEDALRLFHGGDGVVPLSGKSLVQKELPAEPEQVFFCLGPNLLSAKAASISLSSSGGGFFGFDYFSNKSKKHKPNKESYKQKQSSKKGGNSSHEAMSIWQCLVSKSYRPVSSGLTLVAKASQRPPGAKSRRPPATVVSPRTARAKNPRPQPAHAKLLAVALLGMVANYPLGVWMEHTPKYSPQWFAAACAAVPFVGMLPESETMPKTAMAFNLAAAFLGQAVGATAERRWLKALAAEESSSAFLGQTAASTTNTGHCSEEKAGEPLPSKGNGSMLPSVMPPPEVKRWFCGWFCGWSPNVVINILPKSQTYIQG